MYKQHKREVEKFRDKMKTETKREKEKEEKVLLGSSLTRLRFK